MTCRVEVHKDVKAWLAARLKGVGASEAAAVCRLSRWQSPYGLYWAKVDGRVDEPGDANAGAMCEWGHRLERPLTEWFIEAQGGALVVSDPGEYTIYRAADKPHVFATVDRLVHGDGDAVAPLELKTTWYAAAEEWRERVPIAYQIQLQQQMYVLGAGHGFFAVLRNGYDARWYRMERHERFIARLLTLLDEFWGRVERREPPPATGHKSDLAALFARHPVAEARTVELDGEECARLGAEWDAAAQAEAAAASKKADIRATVMQRLGAATHAKLPDDTGFAWTKHGDGRRFTRITRLTDER